MSKMPTAKIREKIYDSFVYYKGITVTSVFLYMDQQILKESEARRKNIAMEWTD